MNLVKFEDEYEPFVTSKEVNVDLVLRYLIKNYYDDFIYDPELPFDAHNIAVYNNTHNYYIRFTVAFIDEM